MRGFTSKRRQYIFLIYSFLFFISGILCTERDVVFVLDRSGSVTQDDYEEAVDFVYNVTKWLTIGPSNIQVSAVSFASNVVEEFDLDDYTTNTTLLDAIDNLKSTSTGGGTYTHSALQYVRDNSLTSGHGARANVPKAVVVMTDGLSANTIMTSDRATNLHNDGVEVYAIGIGNAASSTNTELSDIASDPDSYYLHQVNLFQYLCSIVPEIVPKLDNDTLALSIFRCPTPATTTTPVMTFLNKSRSADSSGDTSSSSSSDSATIAAAASVAAVGTVGAAVGAAVGVAKYLSMLKAQAPNPFVQSIVAQYKNAPLGQGKAKFSHKFKASGGIPAMPTISSKPPVITAWR